MRRLAFQLKGKAEFELGGGLHGSLDASGTPETRPVNNRIIFINRFYDPDISATAQILTKVASHLSSSGRKIAVLTSRQSYSGKEAYCARENRSGVDVHRVWTTRFGRRLLPGRLSDYVSFYFSALFWVLLKVRAGDAVVIKTDPPLLSLFLTWPLKWRGARVVHWLQDIFPEVVSVLGWKGWRVKALKPLSALRNLSLRASSHVVVIGALMAERVQSFGVPVSRIEILENFVDEHRVRPVASANNPLRAEWGLKPDQFCIGYSGNLGRAHDLETIWAASEVFEAIDPDVVFLFVGGGALSELLEQRLMEKPRGNILMKPYQPEHLLSASLSLPDVHWLSLRPELEGLIVPSKFYGIAASGRPAIFIGDGRGEIGQRLSQIAGGISVEQGDVDGLVSAIKVARDPEWKRLAGLRMRSFIDEHAGQEKRLAQWESFFSRL
jgi:colanic acid biosynthesis glycosyl transferase WcaI